MLGFIYLLAATGATANAAPSSEGMKLAAKLEKRNLPVIVIPKPASPRPNPIPQGNPGTWANTNDYPPQALRQQLEGTTGFSVTVGPDGRITECNIMASSGSPELDQATCMNVTRRARFDPALDAGGRPVSGRYQNRVRWQIPSLVSMGSPPLQSNSYPRSPQIVNPMTLRIAADDYPVAALAALQQGMTVFSLDIDASGKVRNCAITTSSGFPVLDRQSCVVAQKWAFEPARNLGGGPVAGRTSHNIHWRLPKGAVAAAPGVERPMINPFQNEGVVTVTLDFGKDGKMVDCAVEHIGALPIFGAPTDLSDNFCTKNMQRGDIKPFTDVDGEPQPRRVVVKMSVDHVDVPAKSVEPSAGQ